MFRTLKTFDDVMAVLRLGGGHVSGRLLLPDSRIVTLTALEVDPVIEIATREAGLQPAPPIAPQERTSEELLGLLGGVPGSLG